VNDTKKLIVLAFAILIGCIIMRIGSWLYFDANTNFFFQNFTRVDGLAIGCLMALWKYERPELLRKKLITLSLSLLIVHAFVASCTKMFWPNIPHFRFLGYTSIAAIFALVIYYGIMGKGTLKKYFLECKWLIWFGKISYGLYIYHSPILILFRIYLPGKLASYGFSNSSSYIFLSVSAAISAILVSWLSIIYLRKKYFL